MNARIVVVVVLALLAACERRLDLGANDPDVSDTDAALDAAGAGDGSVDAGTSEAAIALGGATSCAWRGDQIACWGRADRGQARVEPTDAHADCDGVPCQDLAAHAAIEDGTRVALGGLHGCSLDASGALACWGDNTFGQLGRDVADTDPHAVALAVLENVTDVSLGRFHTCARSGGRVYCWGLGEHGELGIDPATLDACPITPAMAADARIAGATARCATSPREAVGFGGVDAIFAGGFVTCARSGNAAQCAGLDDTGQLGRAKVAPTGMTWTPRQFAVGGVEALALGEDHGCALLAAGNARCWGAHDAGRLGIGAFPPADCGGTACVREPTPVSDLAGVAAIAVGRSHSCALLADGQVRCWGSDARGQLGNSEFAVDTCATPDGDVPCAHRPVEVWDLDDAVAIAAGDDHTCVVRANDEVVCWGDNTLGQIASPNTAPVPRPTPIYHLFP